MDTINRFENSGILNVIDLTTGISRLLLIDTDVVCDVEWVDNTILSYSLQQVAQCLNFNRNLSPTHIAYYEMTAGLTITTDELAVPTFLLTR